VTASSPPNLLLIFADQMRAQAMGCAGNPDVKTPAMDRLAEQGVRLDHCIATYPVCGPNRACLLTGTYAPTNGVFGNDLPLRDGLDTIGTVASAHGYRTGYIGKWHLDGLPRDKFTPPGPRRFGFDDHWAVFNCTHDHLNPKFYRDRPELIEREGYEPQVQTDEAIGFLETAAKHDDPFALVLSWGPPHDPYDSVPEPYRDRYDPASLTLRPNAQPDVENELAREHGLDCRRCLADYYAAVTALDDQLDRLLQTLDQLGLSDDTLVVFTSDHGDMLWSHGLLKKQAPYEESIRVPFIARRPGGDRPLRGGRIDRTLMGTVDLLPTLCGLMGWRAPVASQGRDVSAHLVENAATDPPEDLFIANHLSEDEGVRQNVPTWRGVRTRRYTYAETVGRTPWLLFDNERDPYQLSNRIGEPALAAVERDLAQRLAVYLDITGDALPEMREHLMRHGVAEAWEKRNLTLWGRPEGLAPASLW